MSTIDLRYSLFWYLYHKIHLAARQKRLSKYIDYGKYLRERRLAAKLTQPELARLMGVSQQTISRWESGKALPKITEIDQLSGFLKVSKATLLKRQGGTTSSRPSTAGSFAEPFPLEQLSWENFENFCASFLEFMFPDASVTAFGDKGHDQDGLDIRVTFSAKRYSDFQCKRVKQLGPEEAREVINKYSGGASKKYILLSRVASPKTRNLVRELDQGWEIWDRVDISRKIRMELSTVQQIRLVDTFFHGQRLALLGLPDSSPWLTADSFFAPLMQETRAFNHTWAWVGDSSAKDKLTESIQSRKRTVHILVGFGGCGKTRLLKEICDACVDQTPGVDLYFISPGSDITGQSLADLGARNKVLVVDDAHDRTDLEPLFRYAALADNNASLLLTTRPFGASQIKGTATTYGMVDFLEHKLAPLSLKQATALARQVLVRFGGNVNIAEAIARKTIGCALATAIGAYIVAKEKIHPEHLGNDEAFRNTIFGRFKSIIAGDLGPSVDPRTVKQVLKVVALVQPFEIDDPDLLSLIDRTQNLSVEQAGKVLSELLQAGVLIKRAGYCRLCPDVLADFIIESECLSISGLPSPGVAEEIFDHCRMLQLRNLLFNLGKLEWSRREDNSRYGVLLDSIWKKLKPSSGFTDSHIFAVRHVANYQPERALKFVDNLIRQKLYLEQLPAIVAEASVNPEHLEHCCEALWELGKNDSRALPQTPNHGIRILRELCQFSPFRNLEQTQVAVDFALKLAREPENYNLAYCPVEILKGVFETKVSKTYSAGAQFTLEQFNVPPSLISPIRFAVVDVLIELLFETNTTMAMAAVDILRDSLRYPVSGANQHEWTEIFNQTLSRILKALETRDAQTPVLLALLRALSNRSHYESKENSDLVSKIAAKVPTTLEHRVLQVFMDGWDGFLYAGKLEDRYKQKADLVDTLIEDLSKAYTAPEQLCEFLNRQLADALRNQISKPQFLVVRLLDRSLPLAHSALDWSTFRPGDPLSDYADSALAVVIRDNREKGCKLAINLLQSNSIKLKRSIGAAYWRAGVLNSHILPEELKIFETLLSSQENSIVSAALIVIRLLAMVDKRAAIDLAKYVDLRAHTDLVEPLMDILSVEEIVSQFNQADVEHFLSELEGASLEDYALQVFMTNLSKHYPLETIQFFMDRVRSAQSSTDLFFMLQVEDFGDRVHFRFRETGNFLLLLELGSKFVTSGEDRTFKLRAAELFYYLFRPFDEDVLTFLREWIGRATCDEFGQIAQILNFVPPAFVFSETEFTIFFLQKAERLGVQSHDDATNALYRSATSGIRSGPLGQPFDQDIALREKSEAILTNLSRYSPARKLFEWLRDRATGDIEKSTKRGSFFEFDE